MTTDRVRPLFLAAVGAAAVLLPTAALAQGAATPHDPLEQLNRRTFALNQLIDHYVVGPVVFVYIKVVPKPVRKAVRRFAQEVSFALRVVHAQPVQRIDDDRH